MDVLFVPKQSCNLISVIRCRNNYVRAIFDPGKDSRGACTAAQVGITMVHLIKKRSDSAEAVKAMIKKKEKLTSRKVKRLSGDKALEFLSNSFQGWLCQKVIKHQTSPPYSPESNGKAERVQ